MKIYVASSWRNPIQPEIVERLRMFGHEVYDFRNPHQTSEASNGRKGVGFSWSEIDSDWPLWTPAQFRKALSATIALDGFISDSDAIRWCDALICVPGNTPGRSMHLEAGYAAGLGKRVCFLLLQKCEPELMYKFGEIALSIQEVLSWLIVGHMFEPNRCSGLTCEVCDNTKEWHLLA